MKGMSRRGASILFPAKYYTVHTQRRKEAEVFLFDGLKVTLTEVTQARGCATSRIKYEVEFEAVDPGADGSSTCFISAQLLEQKIAFLLKEIQSICTTLSFTFDRTPAKDLAQEVLLHWKMQDKNPEGLWELLETAIHTGGLSLESENSTNSWVICDLVEHLHHFDYSTNTKDHDTSNELLLAILKVLNEKKVSLVEDTRHRAEKLITSGRLHPKSALRYASLLPDLVHTRAHLSTCLWQMRLEQQNEEADDLVRILELHDVHIETCPAELLRTMPENGLHHLICCLRRLMYESRAPQFMDLLTPALQQEFDPGAMADLQDNVKKVLCNRAERAGEFVLQCCSWFLQNTQNNSATVTNPELTTLWMIDMLELLDIPISEQCRLLAMSQLIQSAPVKVEAQGLEEKLFTTYHVDEALFRNEHYQRILRSLFLRAEHKEVRAASQKRQLLSMRPTCSAHMRFLA